MGIHIMPRPARRQSDDMPRSERMPWERKGRKGRLQRKPEKNPATKSKWQRNGRLERKTPELEDDPTMVEETPTPTTTEARALPREDGGTFSRLPSLSLSLSPSLSGSPSVLHDVMNEPIASEIGAACEQADLEQAISGAREFLLEEMQRADADAYAVELMADTPPGTPVQTILE